jgi:DNA-binding transcriptional LysR family regulator
MFGNSSLASVVRMALDSVGVSVVPIAIVQRELTNGTLRLIRSQSPLPDLSFSAAYPANHDNHMAAIVAQLAVEVATDYGALGPESGD